MIGRSKIVSNAVKILGYLVDNDAMAGKGVKRQQIFDTVGLPEKEFDSADAYLLQQKYVEGTTGGMPGSRWLTAGGVDYYEENKHILEITPQNKRTTSIPDAKKVFVVHGRDSRLRDDFFLFLRALDLQPMEWSEALKLTGKATLSIGEALESAFKNAQAVIVLLSPDDEVRLSPELWRDIEDGDEKEMKLQARPNVLFEAGAVFATHSDRTLLVEIGEVKPFSDIAGRHVVRLSNSPQRRNKIAERLRTAGCDVSTSGKDWLNTGDFNVMRGTKTDSSSYAPRDINEEDLFEAYGINWTKEYEKRCLYCKGPLTYAKEKYGPSVLFCSNCVHKHVLKDNNGNLITEQQAIKKLKAAKKLLEEG
jgi:predicted nucleotide-binding protein